MLQAWELLFGVLFWLSAGLLAYTYIGFWLLLIVRAWLWPRPVAVGAITPSVSLLIAAHNEADVIAQKLDNSLAIDYPPALLDVIVASDGSDDGTNEIAMQYAARGVRLLTLPRQGKNPTVGAAAAAARGELLVFTDADSMLTRDALRQIASVFADPEVGAAAGDYRPAKHTGEKVGERQHWTHERELKRLQSRSGSITAVSGALYAVRRELFVAPPNGVTDDFFVAAQVAAAHRRVVFAPEAVAVGPLAATPDEELARKVRVVSRGLRAVWLNRRLLNPRVYGFYAVQLFSHKVLRRFMVLPLIALQVSSLALWPAGGLYRLAALAQLALHAGAAAGYALARLGYHPHKVLRVLVQFDLANLACLVAYASLAVGGRSEVWHTARVSAKADPT